MKRDYRRAMIRLPKGWKGLVRSAVLQVISLAKCSLAQSHGWASNSLNPRVRHKADEERLQQEVLLLREEMRIKDARMMHLPPQRRPHYPTVERMAILELRAAHGWSLAQTARAFLVTPLTIAEWMRRLDEQGPEALVPLRQPVNKFPKFVHYLVCRLRALCPTMGKVKIAETLARAGLHLGTTTVGRMLNMSPPPKPAPIARPKKPKMVTARCPNQVWHVDLTTVPIVTGFWTIWLPWALPQRWPFCWWVAVIIDHFSRRVMGLATFTSQPTSEAVRTFFGRTIRQASATPKYLICDQGPQFWCDGFHHWCRRRTIRPRFGAVGKQGSIAVVERCILTFKKHLAQLPLVPMRRHVFRREIGFLADWYNGFRPHTFLGGRTPDEVYYHRFPAVRKPRYEPRLHWPRGSPCAKPWALTRSRRGAELELEVAFQAHRRHLPVVILKRAA